MLLVIVPAPQEDRVPFPPALRHSEHIDEEAQALLWLRGQKLHVGEMRKVEDGLGRHGFSCDAQGAAGLEGLASRDTADQGEAVRVRTQPCEVPEPILIRKLDLTAGAGEELRRKPTWIYNGARARAAVMREAPPRVALRRPG